MTAYFTKISHFYHAPLRRFFSLDLQPNPSAGFSPEIARMIEYSLQSSESEVVEL